MGFIIYDLAFLILFTAFVIWFLKKNKKNVTKEGWMFLYKAQWGVKFIDRFAKKHKSWLTRLEPVIIALGYILMIAIVVLIVSALWQYLKLSFSSPIAKVPPVLPLIPYFTNIFGVSSLFPPFYFTYFIIAVLIIAVVHEAAHGIYMKLYKIRIKSTGFAFLGPLLGAFVEQDEKQMNKASSRKQKVILAAGVSANVFTAIFFGIILFLFFTFAFAPAGVNIIGSYPVQPINLSDIDSISDPDSDGLLGLTVGNQTYTTHSQVLEYSRQNNFSEIGVYQNSPAFQARLAGPPRLDLGISAAITEVNGLKIDSIQDLQQILLPLSPGDQITLKTIQTETPIISPLRSIYSGQEFEHTITLAERNGTAFIGITSLPESLAEESITRKVVSYLLYNPADNLSLYYESHLGDFGIFIYYLLWWIVSVNVLVAIFNMLPAGIFDGGRFFYLTVLDLTNSKKKAEKYSKISVNLLWLVLALMLARWAINLIF